MRLGGLSDSTTAASNPELPQLIDTPWTTRGSGDDAPMPLRMGRQGGYVKLLSIYIRRFHNSFSLACRQSKSGTRERTVNQHKNARGDRTKTTGIWAGGGSGWRRVPGEVEETGVKKPATRWTRAGGWGSEGRTAVVWPGLRTAGCGAPALHQMRRVPADCSARKLA